MTETTMSGTPAYARVRLRFDDDAPAAARVKIQGEHGTTYGTPVESSGEDDVSRAPWTAITQAFRAGFVNVQLKALSGDEPARIVDGELESATSIRRAQSGLKTGVVGGTATIRGDEDQPWDGDTPWSDRDERRGDDGPRGPDRYDSRGNRDE